MLPPDDPRLQHRKRQAYVYLGNHARKKRRRKKAWLSQQHVVAFLFILLFAVLLFALYASLRN